MNTIKISTTNRAIDVEAGVYSYDAAFDCSDVHYRTSFDLNVPEQSCTVKFFYTQGELNVDKACRCSFGLS